MADAIETQLPVTAGGDVDYDALFEDRDRTRRLIDHMAEMADDADVLIELAECAPDAWEAFSIAATHQLRKNFIRHGIPTDALPSDEQFESLLRLGYALRVVDEVAGEQPAGKTLTTPDARVIGNQESRGAKLLDGSALETNEWAAAASAVCAQDFEAVAEELLQVSALQALGLASFHELPDGDDDVLMVAHARFGYALRNTECQMIAGAMRCLPGDALIGELDARVSPHGVSELLREVIRYGYCGGAERLIAALPGTTPEARTAAFDARTGDADADDPSTGRYTALALVHYGYLLHRLCELRANWLLGVELLPRLDPGLDEEEDPRGCR